MHLDSPSKRKRGWRVTLIVIAGLLCGAAAGYFFLSGRAPQSGPASVETEEKALPRMANLPAATQQQPIPPEPDYTAEAPVLEQARKALREGLDPEAAVAMAQSLPDVPERADAAFLLLEYAAEKGHPAAAFEVARYYDPQESLPSGTIRKSEANAFEWYRVALERGQRDAAERMEALRQLVRSKADQGSWEARQLLRAWESSSGGSS